MQTPGGARAALVAWTTAVVVSAALIGLTHYTTRDPDSKLYAGISARLSQLPVEQWIAPQWWGFWRMEGPYCEHPVGIFLAPAALARLGFPAEQAAYAVNVIYQAASLVLATLVARFLVDPAEARALGWLLQLLPIAFVFRIRANHEYALLAALLLAVYSTERARSSARWTLGMMAGFCGALLVKGVFALMVPLTCGAWLLARSERGTRTWRGGPAWAAVALMPVAGVLLAWGYEATYVRVAGHSFLAVYLARQVPPDTFTAGTPWLRIPYTAAWYLARIAWYAFPWSLVAAWVAWRGVKEGDAWPPAMRWRARATRDWTAARQGAWFALASGLALAAGLSLAYRKADRYLFPVYFLVGAVGAVAAARRYAPLAWLVRRLDRPWVPAAAYLFLFLLALLTAGSLPTITFWRH